MHYEKNSFWAAYDLCGEAAALGTGQRHGGVDPGLYLLLRRALRNGLPGGLKPQIDQTHRLFQQSDFRGGFDHPAARQEKPGVCQLVSPAATVQGLSLIHIEMCIRDRTYKLDRMMEYFGELGLRAGPREIYRLAGGVIGEKEAILDQIFGGQERYRKVRVGRDTLEE